MNETRPADEMEQIGTFWNPEFHVAFGTCRRGRRSMPHGLVIAQVLAQDVSLLGFDRSLGFVGQAALVRFPRCHFGEEEAAATLLEAIKYVVKEKLTGLDAGKMGYSTDEVGDLVAGCLG